MGKMHLPSFYAGVLSALAIVATHDERVTFDEIVAATGEEELVKTARNDGAMKWSGLSRATISVLFPLFVPVTNS